VSNPILDRLIDSYDARSVGFDSLRPFNVRDILLVASLYDSYTLAEEGQLSERIFGEYLELSLSAPPHITRISTGEKALALLATQRFDMVITMARVGDMAVREFGRSVKEMHPDLPVLLLAYDTRELGVLESSGVEIPGIDRVFVWRGDVRLFLAIIKLVEDQLNAEHDTSVGDVRTLILIEDSIPFYSSYLPMLFEQIMKQTSELIHEGVNPSQRLLRMRARPKILLATTFEEGWDLYDRFRGTILGVISDVRFPRDGLVDPEAGIELIRRIRMEDDHTPLILQSGEERFRLTAELLGAGFLHKKSPTLLQEFRKFMLENFGFGDFVFRLPDGTETMRVRDLQSMVRVLGSVPAESLIYHAKRNHFSNWLMARTEFSIALALRERNVDDFESVEVMREFLRRSLATFRQRTRRGLVEDFDASRFDAGSEFVRIGGGSLGGKGRGLAFAHELLSRHDIEDYFENLRIFVPPSAVVGTDVFDRFMEENDLFGFAMVEADDDAITRRFLASRMPREVVRDLRTFLDKVRYPLAVRSSSLLEDSHHQPFAGVYATRMLPNQSSDPGGRLRELLDAVKYIYASTFFGEAKAYVASTPNRMEEEKMGVVIQQIVGRRFGSFVYPHVSGVACSYNFYPVGGMTPEEGIASVALGLGKTVVEGGRTVRFSPAHPESLPQLSGTEDILENAQRGFWALDVTRDVDYADPDGNIVPLDLRQAEKHGTLWPVGSTYVPDEHTVHDGISRPGVRLVTFAPILKHQLIPLHQVVQLLLEMGYRGFSGPVEIEFAVNLDPEGGGPKEFAFLQIRPAAMVASVERVDFSSLPNDRILVRSVQALGNGRIPGIRDIVLVRMDRFEREKTVEIAAQVGKMNEKLQGADRPYILLGPGRWGTADRWLGIPVSWQQISGARAILECDLDDLVVEPSQGTHFFQNMTSYGIGYFTVHEAAGGFVDWDWLAGLPAEEETEWLRHIRLPDPLEVLIDGKKGEGAILHDWSAGNGDEEEDGNPAG
jgi:hypothetical protein